MATVSAEIDAELRFLVERAEHMVKGSDVCVKGPAHEVTMKAARMLLRAYRASEIMRSGLRCAGCEECDRLRAEALAVVRAEP